MNRREAKRQRRQRRLAKRESPTNLTWTPEFLEWVEREYGSLEAWQKAHGVDPDQV